MNADPKRLDVTSVAAASAEVGKASFASKTYQDLFSGSRKTQGAAQKSVAARVRNYIFRRDSAIVSVLENMTKRTLSNHQIMELLGKPLLNLFWTLF